MKKNWQETTIVVLAVLGMLFSAYGIGLHYSDDGSSFCNISEGFNCDVVNKSQWSTFLGVPVALMGLLAYLFISLLVVKKNGIQKLLAFTNKDFWQYLFLLTFVMCAFQIYLTFIEAYVLKTYCLICLGSQAVILLIVFLVGWLWSKNGKA